MLLNSPAFLRSYQAPKHQLILDTTLWENSGAMGFLGMLTQVIWVGVIFPWDDFNSLPNCNDSCGNVTIPYLCGTTIGCYLNDPSILGYYFINCTTTNAYEQPQPKIGNINVPINEGLQKYWLLN